MCPNRPHKSHRIDRGREVRHVLVVEDNAVTADVIRFYLQRVGYRIAVAYDGSEALSLLEQRRFDLVVTDDRMPHVDGRALCLELRRSERSRRIPVVMLTARGCELDLSDLRRELELIDVFAKPFSPTALVSTVEGCLGSRMN